MNTNLGESKETSLFKSYMAQKFFNACNTLVPQNEKKDLWLDSALHPFIFFVPEILQTIMKEKKFELVFTDSFKVKDYALTNAKIIVLVSSSTNSLKALFEKLEKVSDMATENQKVRQVIPRV